MEIYQVRESNRRYGEVKGYLAVIDFHRPATLDDFPWAKSVETPETFEAAENLIKGLYLTDVNPNPETTDEIVELAESCMINMFERNWDLSLEFILDDKFQPDEPFDLTDILDRFVTALKNDYNHHIEIPTITSSMLDHLSHW
jgi:hypothetical protein